MILIVQILRPCRESGAVSGCGNLAPSRSSSASTWASPVSSLKSLQPSLGPSLLSVSQPFSSSSSSTGLPSPTRHSPDLPSSSKSSDRNADPQAFFTAQLDFEIKKLPNKKRVKLEAQKNKRVQRLVHAVEGVAEFREPPTQFYENFWSVTSPIFNDSKAEPAPKGNFEAALWRLGRLKKARHKILREDELTPRLWLVFHTHEIEHISLQDKSLKTSKGFGLLSAAMEKVANAHSENPAEQTDALDDIKNKCRRGRNYTELEGNGGPGLLFQLGKRVSHT